MINPLKAKLHAGLFICATMTNQDRELTPKFGAVWQMVNTRVVAWYSQLEGRNYKGIEAWQQWVKQENTK